MIEHKTKMQTPGGSLLFREHEKSYAVIFQN